MLISRGILRLAVTFVLALTGLAAVQSGEPLTNGDIVKMVRAQLSTNVIMTTIEATPVKFDLSSAGLISLKEAGVDDRIIEAMQAKARARDAGTTTGGAVLIAPEKSELLATSKEPDFILRNFRTMLVNASRASFFGNDQMKAALTQDKGFAALKISIVDDPAVADVVLDVGYTFAWDYPFSLKHQNTSVVLVSGKGSGPFSGPRGATSVAGEVVKLLKPYRVAPQPGTRKN